MVETVEEDQNIRYATVMERFGGLIADNIFLAVLLLPIAFFPRTLAGIWILLWGLFVLFYTFILEGVYTNQTVGKYILGMKVTRDDGSPMKIRHSLIRNIIGVFGQLFGWIGLIVGAFAIHQSEQNQRLGDSVAGTVVVMVDRTGDD